MHSLKAASHVVLVALVLSLAEAKYYRPVQYNLYKSGPSQHHEPAPTARHKNHCAFVVEKTVTFTVQAGAAPVVKAEYNKCAWGKKCPALQYRLMYKPMYKVAHKSVTELEWRCCPGFSGYGCMEGHYPHSMKALPPFKGPQQNFKGPQQNFKGPQMQYKGPQQYFKGPQMQYKGPQFKGPQFKGPPMKGPVFKGPPVQHNVKSMPWSGNHAAHGRGGPMPGSYPAGRHFGPHVPSPHSPPSYPDSQFEPYPSEPEAQDPHEHPHHAEHEEAHEHERVHEQVHEHEHAPEHHGGGGEPEEHVPEETAPPAGGEDVEGQAVDGETEERLGRMEEDVRRLNLGLETLRGTVNGLEEGLRASLREDANRMLSALLSAAPGGPLAAQAMTASHHAVGFGDIPGGEIPEGDMDARPAGLLAGVGLPGLGELNGRLEALRAELLSKAAELQELRATVMGHDGALSQLSGSGGSALLGEDAQRAMEKLVDAKMSAARAEILGGFERRVESAEERCEEKTGEMRRQCQRERGEGREQMEEALSGSTTHLRRDLASMQAKIHGMESMEESCCGRTTGLDHRVALLEQSVSGLNQSQQHLRVELGGHKDHMEGMVAGRLEYVEAMLNLTESGAVLGGSNAAGDSAAPGGLEAHLDGKLRALEGRLLLVVEELVGNGTEPAGATLEGHVVLPTDLESMRGRLEMDMERVQKHIDDLELRCVATHSVSSDVQADAGVSGQVDENARMALEAQAQRLNSINATLQGLLNHRALRSHPEGQEEEGGPSVQGELSILRFNIQSFNDSLTGLTDSVGTVAQHMEQVNSTWTEREGRLAHQMRGVVQLVGRQASMLGAGDRRLTRLKGELAGMKKRLAGEVQGCRTTALGVRREVEEVGGRVTTVEDQCKGLKDMEAHLERVRAELEGQADSLLSQVNGTLTSHAQQLSWLRDGLLSCTNGTAATRAETESTQHTTKGPTTRAVSEPTQHTTNGTVVTTSAETEPIQHTTKGHTTRAETEPTQHTTKGPTTRAASEPTQHTTNGTIVTTRAETEPIQHTTNGTITVTTRAETEPIQHTTNDTITVTTRAETESTQQTTNGTTATNGTIVTIVTTRAETEPIQHTTNGPTTGAETKPIQQTTYSPTTRVEIKPIQHTTKGTIAITTRAETKPIQHTTKGTIAITTRAETEPTQHTTKGTAAAATTRAETKPTQQHTVPPPPPERRGDTFTPI